MMGLDYPHQFMNMCYYMCLSIFIQIPMQVTIGIGSFQPTVSSPDKKQAKTKAALAALLILSHGIYMCTCICFCVCVCVHACVCVSICLSVCIYVCMYVTSLVPRPYFYIKVTGAKNRFIK